MSEPERIHEIREVSKRREMARERWLALLPESSRSSAQVLYEQYNALSRVRNQAKKELVRESHLFPITRTLETCPGLGEVLVARFVSVVVSPHRFHGRRQLCPGGCDAVVVGLGAGARRELAEGDAAHDARSKPKLQPGLRS